MVYLEIGYVSFLKAGESPRSLAVRFHIAVVQHTLRNSPLDHPGANEPGSAAAGQHESEHAGQEPLELEDDSWLVTG